jgi:hypothetical protein
MATDEIYMTTVGYRTPSSGSESRIHACFKSLEGASKWLMEHFTAWAEDLSYPLMWDEEDMKCPFPDKSIFSVENLVANLEKNEKSFHYYSLWGPYSEYEAQAPMEYFITKTKLHD